MAADEPQFLDVGRGRQAPPHRLSLCRRPPATRRCCGCRAFCPTWRAPRRWRWPIGPAPEICRCSASTIPAMGSRTGDLLNASIGDWLEEAAAMLDRLADRRTIIDRLVDGRVDRALARPAAGAARHALELLAGLVLIAPACDMTERLMWHRMSDEIKATLERDGVYYEPSLYGDPYPITKHLIEEGRNHLHRRRHAASRSAGAHPARHVRSRRAVGPCARPGRSAMLRRCRADAHQGRRPSPVARAGSAPPRIDRRRSGGKSSSRLAAKRGLRGRSG